MHRKCIEYALHARHRSSHDFCMAKRKQSASIKHLYSWCEDDLAHELCQHPKHLSLIHFVATHFSPFVTGQPPCKACLSNVPLGCMLQNKRASPVLGLYCKASTQHECCSNYAPVSQANMLHRCTCHTDSPALTISCAQRCASATRSQIASSQHQHHMLVRQHQSR